MAAAFPFVDPMARIENALWSAYHCRALSLVLASVRDVWRLHPTVLQRNLAMCTRQMKVVVVRILRALSVHPPRRCLSIDQLHTSLTVLQSVVAGSVPLQQFAKSLGASAVVSRVQDRFSEFTSGWKLCDELHDLLNISFSVFLEFAVDAKWVRGLRTRIDDSPAYALSLPTTRSVASSKVSLATSTILFDLKREHCRTPLSEPIQEKGGGKNEKFRLKTLEEHRFATRFQEKKVTLKTWHSALREAHALIRSDDRVKVADALYILLEIIWLAPTGCALASLYLDAGSIYLEFSHLNEAVKAYRNSLRIDSSNWKAQYNLGVASARLQDFVEATRQLKLALKSCPPDIAREIPLMLAEIDQIQSSKNLKAFRETGKARAFTTQYLESLSQVSSTHLTPILPEDYTMSYRSGLPLASACTQVIDSSHEWHGVLASLLHRLHALAWCRGVRVQDELHRIDPMRTGRISVKDFNDLLAQITGSALRVSEQKELARVFGEDGTMLLHYLTPNAEIADALDIMQREGITHAMCDWKVFRKRGKRSAASRSGGLWYWMDITMTKWVEQVLPGDHRGDRSLSQVTDTLRERGYFTPMDFAWKWKSLPEPDEYPMLKLADRGVFIYECHRARTCIQDEASHTLQMFSRRVLYHTRQRRKLFRVHCHHYEQHADEQSFSQDLDTKLFKDTFIDQQIVQAVLMCMDDIVDDLVASKRQEEKRLEEVLRSQEVPIRTEQRQRASRTGQIAVP